RHLEPFMGTAHRLNQETGFRMPWHDYRTHVAAFHETFAGIQTKTTQARVTVTRKAVFRQQRPNPHLKELLRVRLLRGLRTKGTDRARANDCANHHGLHTRLLTMVVGSFSPDDHP